MGKPELHKNSERFGHGIDITFKPGGMTAKPVKPSQHSFQKLLRESLSGK